MGSFVTFSQITVGSFVGFRTAVLSLGLSIEGCTAN